MYLLDTGIVLELRKAKAGRADPGLVKWAANAPRQNLFISAISLIELGGAAARLARKNKAEGLALRGWIDTRLRSAFEGRVLPVDEAVVAMLDRMPHVETRNGLLAATARTHGLTLVTREVAAFKASRVKLLNPRGYAADDPEQDADWRQAAKAGPAWLKNLFVRA